MEQDHWARYQVLVEEGGADSVLVVVTGKFLLRPVPLVIVYVPVAVTRYRTPPDNHVSKESVPIAVTE
jgi:hypothetical protein